MSNVRKKTNGLFVTGTDTSVGKTVVSAILTLGMGAQYWKPIQSGVDPISDTDWIKKFTGLPASHFVPEVYVLSQSISPHASAKYDHIEIDFSRLQLPSNIADSFTFVEGAGGIMVPISSKYFVLDLIKELSFPALVIARSGLGTINHTLLSLERLRKSEIPILGVVLNGPLNPSNREAIEFYGQIPVLAELEPLKEINQESLKHAYVDKFGVLAHKLEQLCKDRLPKQSPPIHLSGAPSLK